MHEEKKASPSKPNSSTIKPSEVLRLFFDPGLSLGYPLVLRRLSRNAHIEPTDLAMYKYGCEALFDLLAKSGLNTVSGVTDKISGFKAAFNEINFAQLRMVLKSQRPVVSFRCSLIRYRT